MWSHQRVVVDLKKFDRKNRSRNWSEIQLMDNIVIFYSLTPDDEHFIHIIFGMVYFNAEKDSNTLVLKDIVFQTDKTL